MKHYIRVEDVPIIEHNHGSEVWTGVFITDDGKYAVYETPLFGGPYLYVETFETLEEASKKSEEGYP
jgi:hypothetical protein